jgi:hypothetical protein
MVAALRVQWWGAFRTERPRLPVRWRQAPSDREEITPTDLELEAYCHLVRHEQARVAGREYDMIHDCLGHLDKIDETTAGQITAAGEHTLIGFCPGISWHWPGEDVPKDMVRKLASR